MATPAPTAAQKSSTPATASTASTASTTTTSAQANAATDSLPGNNTLRECAKLAIEQDRAIMLDYYRETANGTAFLGEDSETKERILVKSKDEFTSLVKKIYKVGDDLIVATENSLYIVSNKILKRKVSVPQLHEAYDASL